MSDQDAGASTASVLAPPGVVVRGPVPAGPQSDLLSPDALEFLAGLQRAFDGRRRELLDRRTSRQARLDQGELPDFLPETAFVRDGDWVVAPLPEDLLDRRVEITGPVDRKMVINALNSGASTFMADFEDSNSPTWASVLQGQVNLRDAIRRTITYQHPVSAKTYALNEHTATLLVRPRGWHLPEKHVLVDGAPMSASLFDFGLFFFHNAQELLARGTGPYFYLPKLESHLEARLWNDVFVHAQAQLGLPTGTIKATVLIETIMAAFEMDEILHELRDHSSGLNCGRWDYIFSFIKRFSRRADFVLPDRGLIGMTQHFLHSYSLLLIRTCHRRRVHAMGGMAAQIPIKGDPAANDAALAAVSTDKLREVTDGHDGTWVAHPALVPLAKAIFDEHMPGPNQLDVARDDVQIDASDLLTVPSGPLTEAGLRKNCNVGVQYLEAWLSGNGCVPLYNLMEDAATAEISRTQIWQCLRHDAQLDNGDHVTQELVTTVLTQELAGIRAALGDERYDAGRFDQAAELFLSMSTAEDCAEFLTLAAYDQILTLEPERS
jgi:malate synthase